MHLIVSVWELDMGKEMNPVFKDWFLQQAINPDKITRHRRKFQEQGQYPASEKVEGRRYKKFKQVRGEGVDAL